MSSKVIIDPEEGTIRVGNVELSFALLEYMDKYYDEGTVIEIVRMGGLTGFRRLDTAALEAWKKDEYRMAEEI